MGLKPRMSEKRLKGQVAWITGTASGIGQGIAELFGEEGAKCALIDQNADGGAKVAEDIERKGGETFFQPCDVADEAQVRDTIEAAVDRFGGLQILVNCAGIGHYKLLHEYGEDEWDRLMDVNVKSIFLSVKHGVPHLLKNKPELRRQHRLRRQFYRPVSHAVLHHVEGGRPPAHEVDRAGLRCSWIAFQLRMPRNHTETPSFRHHLTTTPDPRATRAKRLSRVPMGVAMQPRDIAKAVRYLSCEDSSGVTGTSLIVDGGYIATAEWETEGKTAFADSPD